MSGMWIAFHESEWQPYISSSCLVPSFITDPMAYRCEIIISIRCIGSTNSCRYCEIEENNVLYQGHHYVSFGANSTKQVWMNSGKHIKPLEPNETGFFTYIKIDALMYSNPDRDFTQRVVSFLIQQVGKPFNMSMYPSAQNKLNLFLGLSNTGAKLSDSNEELINRLEWFCSELVSSALIYGGLDDHIPVDPKDITPVMLKRILLERVKGCKIVAGTDSQLALISKK